MKNLLVIFFSLFSGWCFAQQKVPAKISKPITVYNQVVDASCGECQFKMEGKSCDLAVKINGVPYFVDGTNIDDHGDAHAKDGFCEKIRKARVSGEIINNRFKASSFKLLPEKDAAEAKPGPSKN